jgi:hypothetical protein
VALLFPDQNECIIANPAFVVYSSIVSFYVPFIVTLLVYIKIYIVLRKRRKRVNTKRSSRAFRANLKTPLKVPRSSLPSKCPYLTIVKGACPMLRWGPGTSQQGDGYRSWVRVWTSVKRLECLEGGGWIHGGHGGDISSGIFLIEHSSSSLVPSLAPLFLSA